MALTSGGRIADNTGDIFIPANGARKGLAVGNTDTTRAFFSFHKNPAVVGQGWSLGFREQTLIQDLDIVKNELRIITAAGTADITFEEF